ncbi:type II secretion system F family protein [Kocuria coralli]|nr:type II secretion system F family protein [Kocuria coralli]
MNGPPIVMALLVLLSLALIWLPAGTRTRVTGALGVPGRSGGSAGTAGASGPASRLVRAVRNHRRSATTEAGEWAVWMRQLATLLRSGRSPGSAFGVEAESLSETPDPSPTGQRMAAVCRTVAGGASVGLPPSATLRSLARTPAADRKRLRRIEATVLTDLARCWEISERTGAPLAALLEGLADATEADLDAAAARETALAGSRSTVRILSWLPVMALGLGVLIGADPIRTLLTNPWGIAAGVAGAVLTLAGRVWTVRMVRAAEHATGRDPA